jgi:hypothetical protein
MARLFDRPETPLVTIAHGAQSTLTAQNIDFVGHGSVPGLWEVCAQGAPLGRPSITT